MAHKLQNRDAIYIYNILNTIESKLVGMKKLMVFITIDDLPSNKTMYDRVNQMRDECFFHCKEIRAKLEEIDGLDESNLAY